ncbi:MAG: hypothetical protein QW334_04290 [Thermofilum sp.]
MGAGFGVGEYVRGRFARVHTLGERSNGRYPHYCCTVGPHDPDACSCIHGPWVRFSTEKELARWGKLKGKGKKGVGVPAAATAVAVASSVFDACGKTCAVVRRVKGRKVFVEEHVCVKPKGHDEFIVSQYMGAGDTEGFELKVRHDGLHMCSHRRWRSPVEVPRPKRRPPSRRR